MLGRSPITQGILPAHAQFPPHPRHRLLPLLYVASAAALSATTAAEASEHGRELRQSNNGTSVLVLFVVGLCLLVLGPVFLVAVERSGVETAKLLTHARKLTVTDMDPAKHRQPLDGHMTHFVGQLQLDGSFKDAATGMRWRSRRQVR